MKRQLDLSLKNYPTGLNFLVWNSFNINLRSRQHITQHTQLVFFKNQVVCFISYISDHNDVLRKFSQVGRFLTRRIIAIQSKTSQTSKHLEWYDVFLQWKNYLIHGSIGYWHEL